jgi:allantoinase
MTPQRYGPLAYLPITRRPKLTWPGGARVALWVNPNIEFFGLDDVMPGNLNERVPREHAKIPNVRNWAVRDYGNRVGIWRILEVSTRYCIRASAALNSEVCDHHPEIIEEAGRLGWELVGHNQTNARRLTEMDGSQECDAVRVTIDRIEMASGKRSVGWLGAGLAETWDTLDYLAEAGIRYVCDWVSGRDRGRGDRLAFVSPQRRGQILAIVCARSRARARPLEWPRVLLARLRPVGVAVSARVPPPA